MWVQGQPLPYSKFLRATQWDPASKTNQQKHRQTNSGNTDPKKVPSDLVAVSSSPGPDAGRANASTDRTSGPAARHSPSSYWEDSRVHEHSSYSLQGAESVGLLRWEQGKDKTILPDPHLLEVSANAAYIWFEGYIMPTSQDSYILDTSWELPSQPRSYFIWK